MINKILFSACLITLFFSSLPVAAEEIPLPAVYLNGKVVKTTVQELGGIGTKPLRALVKKNNKAHGDELIQVYAMGTRDGDHLRIDIERLAPGVRATFYKLRRDTEGNRDFTMPLSIYSDKISYYEKIAPYKSEYLIIVFEKTDRAEKKSANQIYFEEHPGNLIVKTMKPNLKLSSIKLKMQDSAGKEKTFSYDAQELIDRFVNLQRIFVVRLWRDERPAQQTPELS